MSPAVEDVKASLGPMRDLLARHGFPTRGKTTRCPSPDHDDRNPSASMYVAPDGDERVHCHSCGFDEDVIGVARVLGERVPSLRSLDQQTVRRRADHAPTPNYRLRALGRVLIARGEWPFEWAVATLLARLDPFQARVEVVRNWDYLSARGDIPLIWQTANMIRGVALLTVGTAKAVERPGAIGYAVDQLLRESEPR